MATKKATGKGMTKWDEELARRAELSAKMEAAVGEGGNFLSTRGGILKYKDNAVPGNKMNVIVLNHVIENAYYGGEKFNPEDPKSPICYAFGTDEEGMTPHEKSEEPQHTTCEGCPQAEWGTADTGNGKACKNIRRLALITEDSLEDVESAQPAFLKIPVTSVRAWAGYVKQLKETLKRPTCSVVTEISIVPDVKHQFHVQFKLIEKIDGEVLGELFEKADKVAKALTQPYQPNEEIEKRTASRAKPKAKGKAAPARGKR